MMNKLTERDEYGNADIIGVDSEDLQMNLGFDELNKVTDALNKLAAYEDTGLEPEDIANVKECLNPTSFSRFREIMYAEHDGRLVVLPCKVGDTVYKLSWDCARGIRYYPFNEDGYSTAGSCLKCEKYPCDIHKAVREEAVNSLHWILDNQIHFGKTVFLIKEEAEQALKGIKSE